MLAESSINREAVERVIRGHYPDAVQISYIDHGYDNLVAVVDERYVFRIPRDNGGAKRLQFEVALLRRLEGKVRAAIIPTITQANETPPYAITPYVAGNHLTNAQIQALPVAQQTAIGQRLAQFMCQLNQAIAGDAVHVLRHQAGVDAVDESWPQYFERLFVTDPLPDARLKPFVEQCYPDWLKQIAAEQATYAIHDDLHVANLLFVDADLQGVLDFGDANQGSIEEEMRVLYPMSEHVLQAAIATYGELTGVGINPEHVRLWAITQELASFTDRLSKGQREHPTYQRGLGNLRRWFPDFPL
jgi:aminoglycoside phosphotransferase (APT) family kinase protein